MSNTRKITKATKLQLKSDAAIAAFKSLIDGLKATNDEANAAKVINDEKINELQIENAAICALTEKNERIIQNVENLLGV